MPIETSSGLRYTKREAAAYLGLSARHVQRLVGQGQLGYMRAHGHRGDVLLFSEEELNRFAEAKRAQLYVPKIEDTPIGDTIAPDVPALVPAGALQSGDFIRQLGEAIAKAGTDLTAQLVDGMAAQLRRDHSLLELAAKTWLTRREAVKLSGLPAKVVHQALVSGVIGAKFGGRWMIRREALERFAVKWSPVTSKRR